MSRSIFIGRRTNKFISASKALPVASTIEEANIELQIDEKKWTNHETSNPQFYIDYVGQINGAIRSRDLQIDISKGEILDAEIVIRSI